MRQDILNAIKSFEQKNDMQGHVGDGRVQLLGTSGTITTLTAMYMELEIYDRNQVDGARVKSSHIRALCRKLSTLNYDQRLAVKGIGADRADLVVAGCAILESIMDLWPIEEIRVADRGIREGMLLDMMDSYRKKPGGKSGKRPGNRPGNRYGSNRKKKTAAGQNKTSGREAR